MELYTFYHKNNSNYFSTKQESEEDAWKELEDTMKDIWGWELTDEGESNECDCGQPSCPRCN